MGEVLKFEIEMAVLWLMLDQPVLAADVVEDI